MGLYRSKIFPRLMDRVMSAEAFGDLRERVLERVRGDTLEIGFGSGLNLDHYPRDVTRITAIDSNPGMQPLARARLRRSDIDVDLRIVDGRALPFESNVFDSIVSTWTLCSISEISAALAEVRRVLKPDGSFLFVEHGLSRDPGISQWQRRLTPIQRRIADGCHLDRNIPEILEEAGLAIRELEAFYMDGVPRIGGFLYTGVATRRP